MKTRTRNVVIFTLLIGFLCFGLKSDAYVLTGSKWESAKASYYANGSGGPAYGVTEIINAINEWNNVGTSSFEFTYLGTTGNRSLGNDGVNKAIFSPMSGSTIGYATWWSAGGKTFDADIQMRSNFTWTNDSLRAVTLHEFGHALGLSHSSTYNAIMYYAMHGQKVLHQDDKNGISYLYPGGSKLKGIGGIDGVDFRDDLIWQSKATGGIEVWQMDGVTDYDTLNGRGDVGTIIGSRGKSWQVLTTGDFNGDGKRDIFWKNTKTGRMDIWLLDGTTDYATLEARGDTGMIRETMSSSWVLKRKGDFNGDNREDLLWQHKKTGRLLVWLLDGVTHVNVLGARGDAAVIRSKMSSSWDILKLGDYNGDGRDDLMWQHKAKGKLMVWLMDGTTPVDTLGARGDAAVVRGSMSKSWALLKMGDFNADGKDDFIWRHKSKGKLMIWLLDGVTHINTIGSRGDAAVIRGSSPSTYTLRRMDDFNGDGKDDFLWQHKKNGNLNLWLIDGVTHYNTLAARGDIVAFHPANISSKWKLRGSGDFDGDGMADLLWIHDNGTVNVWLMDGKTPYSTLASTSQVATIA